MLIAPEKRFPFFRSCTKMTSFQNWWYNLGLFFRSFFSHRPNFFLNYRKN